MSQHLILLGSSRSTGNSARIAAVLQKGLQADLVDLRTLDIHPYCYEHKHRADDFLPLMRRTVEYKNLILVTPVYWYAMSGIMKTFLDRITDCLKIEKETGRRLRGMGLAAVACGSEEMETEGFFVPFRLSAAYLGMHYRGDVHTWIEDIEISPEVIQRLSLFTEQLKAAR